MARRCPSRSASSDCPVFQLWIAPTDGTLLATQNGAVSLSLAIPASPALAGLTRGAQALSFDALAPGGLAVSNAAILRVY